jgi:hypothetical protein
VIYLKNYKLFETQSEIKFDKIINILESDCGEFLNLLRENNISSLYRGFLTSAETFRNKMGYKGSGNQSNILDGVWKIEPIEKRKAKDTNWEISELIDRGLERKFGIPLRSRGVFATKNLSIASDYAGIDRLKDTYMFFPKNGFRYFWNPNIDDLFTELRDNFDWYEEYDNIEITDEVLSDINWIVNGYQEGNISRINLQEITFICDEYYLLDLKYFDEFENYIK